MMRCVAHSSHVYTQTNTFQIEQSYPALERFHGQWGAAFLVRESFHAQKTYTSCKGKEGTYRARMRRPRRSRVDSEDDNDQEWGGIGPTPSEPGASHIYTLSVVLTHPH